MSASQTDTDSTELSPYLSRFGAWALALGCAIGWGSFVVTSNTYLAQAGPVGSALGMLVGMVVMLVVARNYHYMMNRLPDAGGAYSYAKSVFGYDQGLLTAWFLGLTYAAVFWANATSLPLFSRYFLGGMFQFGFHYQILGYEVYLGEALLSIVAVVVVGLLCMRSKRTAVNLVSAMVVLFVVGIVVCFGAAMVNRDAAAFSFDPVFAPDTDAISQIVAIACISPWAFIGFESISHSAEEFAFPVRNTFRIFVTALVAITALYVFVTTLSVTAYPAGYDTWFDYIKDLGSLSGIEALPAFYAANYYLGGFGVSLLMLSLLALILTSFITNILALSRLLYALGKDRVLPPTFSKLNDKGIPSNAIAGLVLVSMVIPFLGRTAIGWIVDVTTIGATIVYGFVSASAFVQARKEEDPIEVGTGIVGTIAMVIMGLVVFLPSLFMRSSMATESFMLFTIWAMLGFLFCRSVMQHDEERRFGKSVVMWIALFSLALFVSIAWMGQEYQIATDTAITNIEAYYAETDGFSHEANDTYVEGQLGEMHAANMKTNAVVLVLFGASLVIMISNFTIMRRREEESERKLGAARSAANTDAMTGVKNKRAYAEIEHGIDTRIADGLVDEFAIVVCDVNGLKRINDTLGHKAGDEYIRSASRVICEQFKHSPVFRIGGDEFVSILEGHDYLHRDDLLVELDAISVRNVGTDNVIIAAGLSEFRPGEDGTVQDVFERADTLMYEHKKVLKGLDGRSDGR